MMSPAGTTTTYGTGGAVPRGHWCHGRPRTIAAAAVLAMTLAACADRGSAAPPDGAGAPTAAGSEEGAAAIRYTLPGDSVFPEGVGVDKETGDFYVGSTQDGAVYRGNVAEPGEAELFLEPGVDGREQATGVEVFAGRLFVAGRRTGRAFVYDVRTGELIRAFDTGAGEGLLNDWTFTEDAAYLTDSFRPTLWRVPLDADGPGVGEIEPWLDLTDSPISYDESFNLNGVSASDDGRHLLAVHTVTGELWRIDVATKEVERVDLGGTTLGDGDGVLLDGRTAYVVRNSPAVVARVELSEDLLEGEVTAEITNPAFRFPTTIAEYDGTLLVVNSQLNRESGGAMSGGGDGPELPFTVVGVPLPATRR